jgi:hypothetical protein
MSAYADMRCLSAYADIWDAGFLVGMPSAPPARESWGRGVEPRTVRRKKI